MVEDIPTRSNMANILCVVDIMCNETKGKTPHRRGLLVHDIVLGVKVMQANINISTAIL